MPVPANTVRVNIRATLAGIEEIVHTLHFERVNTANQNPPSLQQIAAKVVEEWTEFLTTGVGGGVAYRTLLKATVVYQMVDVYELDADGHATEQAQQAFGGNIQGTSPELPLPPEVALCCSLRTGLPGRARRGRLYLGGLTTGSLNGGGGVAVATQTVISKGLARFGTDMKMQVGLNVDRLNWVVLSRSTTETNRITRVQVGDLFDVQRRRQNKIPETFIGEDINY